MSAADRPVPPRSPLRRGGVRIGVWFRPSPALPECSCPLLPTDRDPRRPIGISSPGAGSGARRWKAPAAEPPLRRRPHTPGASRRRRRFASFLGERSASPAHRACSCPLMPIDRDRDGQSAHERTADERSAGGSAGVGDPARPRDPPGPVRIPDGAIGRRRRGLRHIPGERRGATPGAAPGRHAPGTAPAQWRHACGGSGDGLARQHRVGDGHDALQGTGARDAAAVPHLRRPRRGAAGQALSHPRSVGVAVRQPSGAGVSQAAGRARPGGEPRCALVRRGLLWGRAGGGRSRNHLRRVRQPGTTRARRPGSSAWPALRREAERRFSDGEPPARVIGERRAHHGDGPARAPSVRTMRRWFTDGRWLAQVATAIAGAARRAPRVRSDARQDAPPRAPARPVEAPGGGAGPRPQPRHRAPPGLW
jgi:hypothetical protein